MFQIQGIDGRGIEVTLELWFEASFYGKGFIYVDPQVH